LGTCAWRPACRLLRRGSTPRLPASSSGSMCTPAQRAGAHGELNQHLLPLHPRFSYRAGSQLQFGLARGIGRNDCAGFPPRPCPKSVERVLETPGYIPPIIPSLCKWQGEMPVPRKVVSPVQGKPKIPVIRKVKIPVPLAYQKHDNGLKPPHL